jgi:type I restriction enzyme S subunit
MEWPKKELGELADVCRGSSPRPIADTRYFDGGTVPWVKIADATKSGKFLYETKQHVNDFGASFSRRLPPGTILVAASGTLGYTQILGIEGCAHDGWLILQNLRELDRDFAYYALKTLEQHFFNSGSGAAIQNINTDILRQTEIPYPPLPVQQRIAGILSAYDELIENSQRRIKILESMARALYREWFVHFRFPGHEHHPRVASPLGEIPQGWEVKPFSALANYINGYPFKPAQLGQEGKPIIKIKELKAGIVTDTPRNLGHEIPAKYTIQDGYVLFSWSADLDAYLWMGGEGLLNQHLFNVVPFEGISRAFCFHALKESMPRFRALSLGATMHHIKRSALDQVFTLLPPADLRERFEVLVEPMHQQLITLTKHVENLRRTRDLLLPRLLSGQIEVGAADSPAFAIRE